MALDDAFQSSTDAVLLDMAQRPRPPVKQAPAFSTWGLVKAAPRGALSGLSQAAGSAFDVLEAAAQVQGSLGQDDWMMPDPAGAARQTEAARKRLKDQGGPTFDSDVGRSFRNVGRDYMPDPVTSHGAEQAVANLFRVGVKAVGAGVALGPIGGAVVAGAEEGFSAADDLRDQGVDLATRTKVGAVTAAFTAGSFALPVAGQTWKATAGLALAGGPASFIGQNAATREILNNADYSTLASQYDPFDPVGLTLSTLLPLGFGALAMRGARGAKPAGEPVKPGEVPVTDPVAGQRPDAEAVDSARVNLLRENIDNTRPSPPEDLAGAAAHETAVTRAIDQMAAGERVTVSDVASPSDMARIADDLNPRLTRVLEEITPIARATEPAADVEAALAGHQAITDKLGDRYRVTVHEETLGAAKDTQGVFVQVFDPITGQRRGRIDFAVNKDGTLAAENTNVAPSYQRRGIAQAMYQAAIDAGYTVVPGRKQTDVGARMVAGLQEKGLIGGEKVRPPEAVPSAPAKEAAGTVLKSESPEIDRAANLIEADRPDMLVHLEGQDAPVPLGELMKRIREELGRDLQESPLIEAAAACFVSSGG